jgi:hypothetical protein
MSEIDEDDVFFIKQFDLEPPLDIAVSGATGDLGDVGSWTVVGSRNGDLVFEDTDAEFIPGANPQTGVVRHAWETGETDLLGSMDIEARAIWPSNRPQTFPPRRYCRVVVSRSLP